MRLLLIVQDARFRSLIRHHVTCEWPDARPRRCVPRARRRRLPPEFLAQGYDAVLIDEQWLGGQGLAWLRGSGRAARLRARSSSSPRSTAASRPRRARIFGAFARARQAALHPRDTDRGAGRGRARASARAGGLARFAGGRASRRFGAVRIPGLPLRAAPGRAVRCRSSTWPKARRPAR